MKWNTKDKKKKIDEPKMPKLMQERQKKEGKKKKMMYGFTDLAKYWKC